MIINRILKLYRNLFWSLEKQARHAGVIIGEHNFISSHFWSSEPYLITIGNNCQITSGVKIFTHGGAQSVRKYHPEFDCFGKIKIGNYVYIGSNSLILPGVTIGNNVLIAAGSVVTKSVPSDVVVGGNPARIVCSIGEYIERNAPFNRNSKSMSNHDKKVMLTKLEESKFIQKKEMVFR